MATQEKVTRRREIYSFLPVIDRLSLQKHGLQNGHWVGLVGEPASFKTVFTKWAMKKWLEKSEGNVVIYVATEENNQSIKDGLVDFGIDVEKYKRLNKLSIGSVFCYQEDKDEMVQNSPNGVTQFAMKKITEIASKFGSFAKIRVMLIIDSMASFWSHAPATSRAVWTTIYGSLFHKVDLGLMTFQLAASTHKAFGWGAEHGVDAIFRFGKYVDDADSFRYFVIDKLRNDKEDGRIWKTKVENNEFMIDDLVPAKGKYASSYEAIVGMKYENEQNIQKERNVLLEKLVNIMGKFSSFFGLFVKRSKKSNEEEKEEDST